MTLTPIKYRRNRSGNSYSLRFYMTGLYLKPSLTKPTPVQSLKPQQFMKPSVSLRIALLS